MSIQTLVEECSTFYWWMKWRNVHVHSRSTSFNIFIYRSCFKYISWQLALNYKMINPILNSFRHVYCCSYWYIICEQLTYAWIFFIFDIFAKRFFFIYIMSHCNIGCFFYIHVSCVWKLCETVQGFFFEI